jgi:hypothetical protein
VALRLISTVEVSWPDPFEPPKTSYILRKQLKNKNKDRIKKIGKIKLMCSAEYKFSVSVISGF